jgi:uncharacterized membrane protein
VADSVRREEVESRWEAAPAVVVVIAMQLLLAFVSHSQGWRMWHLPWWVWLVPAGLELLLWGALTWDRPRHRLEQIGRRREASLTLLAIISVANATILVAVLGSLIEGHEKSGAQLLLKALTVWTTNVITFGLWFWALDQGGPVRRLEPDPPKPDFLFPQLDDPELAGPDWRPSLFDYLYVSFTNSIAFSPTDVLPLTHRAKVVMLLESSVSSVTILLVAARAVNIFS